MSEDATTPDEVPESPATWENVAVGKAEELLGRATGNERLKDEGEEREEIAREVRGEYEAQHDSGE
jgi:uncharacterized protein YjbJ (UPF0337 family)